MAKIVSCGCGRRAESAILGGGYFHVRCLGRDCWIGPTRKTEGAAVEAWNQVMRRLSKTQVKGQADGR